VLILFFYRENGYLKDSDKYKPAYVVFVSHSQDRYDLAISEIKAPVNKGSNNVIDSDLVKTGKELHWMINSLIRRGVHDPVVCGSDMIRTTSYAQPVRVGFFNTHNQCI